MTPCRCGPKPLRLECQAFVTNIQLPLAAGPSQQQPLSFGVRLKAQKPFIGASRHPSVHYNPPPNLWTANSAPHGLQEEQQDNV